MAQIKLAPATLFTAFLTFAYQMSVVLSQPSLTAVCPRCATLHVQSVHLL